MKLDARSAVVDRDDLGVFRVAFVACHKEAHVARILPRDLEHEGELRRDRARGDDERREVGRAVVHPLRVVPAVDPAVRRRCLEEIERDRGVRGARARTVVEVDRDREGCGLWQGLQRVTGTRRHTPGGRDLERHDAERAIGPGDRRILVVTSEVAERIEGSIPQARDAEHEWGTAQILRRRRRGQRYQRGAEEPGKGESKAAWARHFELLGPGSRWPRHSRLLIGSTAIHDSVGGPWSRG